MDIMNAPHYEKLLRTQPPYYWKPVSKLSATL